MKVYLVTRSNYDDYYTHAAYISREQAIECRDEMIAQNDLYDVMEESRNTYINELLEQTSFYDLDHKDRDERMKLYRQCQKEADCFYPEMAHCDYSAWWNVRELDVIE